MSSSESQDDTVNDPQPVIGSKHSEKKDSSKLTKFTNLESSKKLKVKVDQSEKVDRAMESDYDFTSHLLQQSDDDWSLDNSPQRRLPETRRGSGPDFCEPDLDSGLAPLISQATADATELSLALEREKSLKSSRDGLALDQIRDRGTILDLQKEVENLKRQRDSWPDYSWDSRTLNQSQVISGDCSQAQRSKPQSGGLSERAGRKGFTAPFLPRTSSAGAAEAPVTVPIGRPAGAMDATSKSLVKGVQLALNDVFTQLRSLRESGMSKEAHSGSGLLK